MSCNSKQVYLCCLYWYYKQMLQIVCRLSQLLRMHFHFSSFIFASHHWTYISLTAPFHREPGLSAPGWADLTSKSWKNQLSACSGSDGSIYLAFRLSELHLLQQKENHWTGAGGFYSLQNPGSRETPGFDSLWAWASVRRLWRVRNHCLESCLCLYLSGLVFFAIHCSRSSHGLYSDTAAPASAVAMDFEEPLHLICHNLEL